MAMEAVERIKCFTESSDATPTLRRHVKEAFSVLYSCVIEVVDLVTGHILPLLYCHRLSETDEGRLTIRCQLVKHNWSEAMILQKFRKFQDLLDTDVRAMEKVDARFGCMIIKELCNKVFGILTNDTRANILLLPNYKFKICRSYGKNLWALKQEVRKLKDFVSGIYSEMNEEFRCRENNFATVTAVLNSTSQKMECDINIPELQQLPDEMQILISAQQELHQQYEALQVRGPFQFLTGQNHGSESILAPLRTGAVERGPPVPVKDLLTTTLVRNDIGAARVLLVSGVPGAGKTSLCYYLLKNWCRQTEQVDGLEHVDLVLLVEWARVRSCVSLNSFLSDNLLGHTKARFPEQLCTVASLVNYNVLVLVDGFSVRDDKEGELLQEVFQLFKSNCILMTTVPTSLGYIESVFLARNNLASVIVSVCRLNPSTRLCLVEHACRVAAANCKENQGWFKQFKEHHLKGLDRVLDHCREPATALLYAALWRPNEPSPFTPSRLHRFLLEGLYEKFIISHQVVRSQTSKWDHTSLFHRLGELAWLQLCRDHHRVPEHMAKEMEVEELLPVLFTAIENTYSFASLSQQLYLAAIFLAQKIMSDSHFPKTLEKKHSIWEKNPELLLLTVGELNHLACDPTAMRAALRLSRFTSVRAEDLEYWYLLAQEGCHSPIVTQYVVETLPARHWFLGSTTLVPGLKLLTKTCPAVQSISVDIPNDTEPYHIPELMETLQKMRACFKGKVKLELYLWKHDVYGGVQPSNQLLRAFTPWSTITNFTGEIGPEEGEARVFDSRWTRTLRVRVSSPAALHTLRVVTRRLTKVCQKVRVTLVLPDRCSVAKLEPLDCSNLHLTMQEVHEQNKSWVVGVVRRVAGNQPVWRLYLNTCSLSVGSMPSFFRELRGVVADKVSLHTFHDVDDGTQRHLQQVIGCTISWL